MIHEGQTLMCQEQVTERSNEKKVIALISRLLLFRMRFVVPSSTLSTGVVFI